MKRILFVEPDKKLHSIYTQNMRPQDNEWDLQFSETAQDALEKATHKSYDLVVATNILPDGPGGLELLTNIKNLSPGTIRFLLVNETEPDAHRALVGAPQQILTKPLNLKNFMLQTRRAFALRSAVRNPNILQLLGKAEALPPLPRVFHQVSQKLSDSNASLHDVAKIIEKDIVLSSKVLKLANSALFNLRVPANTVTQAVSLLGSHTISSLIFNLGVSDSFKGGAATEQFIEKLNTHSLICAKRLTTILRTWNAEKTLIDKAFFCGIAHDLGKLVLAKYAPGKWIETKNALHMETCSDVEIEREIIGIDHAEIAAYLLALWGFPNDQIIAVAFHHAPSKIKDREFGLLCGLHLADNLVYNSFHPTKLDWAYLEDCRLPLNEILELQKMFGPEE